MLFASLAKARQPGGASEVNPDSKCLINADPVHKLPKLSHSRGQLSGGGQP
jgi:hypothetical protein